MFGMEFTHLSIPSLVHLLIYLYSHSFITSILPSTDLFFSIILTSFFYLFIHLFFFHFIQINLNQYSPYEYLI